MEEEIGGLEMQKEKTKRLKPEVARREQTYIMIDQTRATGDHRDIFHSFYLRGR